MASQRHFKQKNAQSMRRTQNCLAEWMFTRQWWKSNAREIYGNGLWARCHQFVAAFLDFTKATGSVMPEESPTLVNHGHYPLHYLQTKLLLPASGCFS